MVLLYCSRWGEASFLGGRGLLGLLSVGLRGVLGGGGLVLVTEVIQR